MKTIIFQSHSGNSAFSGAIKKLSAGDLSHSSTLFVEDNCVIEAREGKGVIDTNVLAWDDSTVVKRYELTVSNKVYDSVYAWSRKQIGKKYDWTGVFAHLLPIFMKPKMGKWYCSELMVVILAKTLGVLGDDMANRKKSPSDVDDILIMLKLKQV